MMRTAKWHDFIQLVPHEAVLTESDGPFAKHDSRPALPTDMPVIIRWLADSWKQHPQDVEDQVANNCRRATAIADLPL